MQSRIELLVNGPSSGTTIGQIDLFGDEPISLTYSIADIKDISKRNGSYSQSFTVPASKNNNKLFNHIFNIGADSSFDPGKKTPSYLLVDSQMVINGNLQLIKIKVKDKNPISYDVVIYGETIDLVKSLGDSYLTDLDFTELDHNKTSAIIANSWTSSTQNLGYYYPLIDYGYDLDLNEINNGIITGSTYTGITSTGGGMNPALFYPALSNKYIFDKIFNNINYSYTSDFINSSAFTETIIPYNGNDTLSIANDLKGFKASLTASTFILNTGTTLPTPVLLPFKNDSTDGNYDYSGLYSPLTLKYTASTTGVIQFCVNLSYSYNIANFPGGTTPIYDSFYVRFYRSSLGNNSLQGTTGGPEAGLFGSTIRQILKEPNSTVGNVMPHKNLTITGIKLDGTNQYNYPAQPGETFWVKIITPNNSLACYQIYDTNTSFYNVFYSDGVVNSGIIMNNYVPKKVKQVDYLKSVFTMFNLMIIPNKNNAKNLEIVPRNEYFGSGVVKDWTSKLDLSSGIEETLINEQQARQIQFSYTPDKDYFNTFYSDDTKKVYGEYIHKIDNEWLDPNSKQEIKVIFSPTPMENIPNTDIIVPKIGKMDNNGAFGKTDFNIRFLRKNPTMMPTAFSIKLLGLSAQTSYPYAGHLSHPFSTDADPIDYNFGTSEYAFYTSEGSSQLEYVTPNNLVNKYWKSYLDDISDKNSKLIKCKVHLTPADIAQFNYNDTIFIDGLTDDGGHYFIVNKLTYIPTANQSSEIELIKINRLTSKQIAGMPLAVNKNTTKRNSISLGGAVVDSRNSIGIGNNTTIASSASGTFVIGDNNSIGDYSSGAFVTGNNNNLGSSITNAYVVGSNNTISIPSGSTILSGITIFGNNVTATTANTLYVPNIQFTTSAGTINGTSISAITQSSNLWASGTGIGSIVQLGGSCIANGDYNIAEGYQTIAIGTASHAEGHYSKAYGDASHAEGYNTEASSLCAHAEGSQTLANGYYSHAEGTQTIASGTASHAEGYLTKTYGYASHAEGVQTIANAQSSHAEGQATIAYGYASHSEGTNSIASGQSSHAEGQATKAYGFNSHTEGYNTEAYGYASHAAGDSNIAVADYSSIVGGRLNIASGVSSSILAGTGHTVTGRNSAIIGGGSITGSANDTVYVPNLNLQANKGISFGSGSKRIYKEINIGNWDMTSLSFITNHSLSATEWKTVRSISVLIRNDADTNYYDFCSFGISGSVGGGTVDVNSTTFGLSIISGSFFNSTTFDSTGYNRGFINFWYTPD